MQMPYDLTVKKDIPDHEIFMPHDQGFFERALPAERTDDCTPYAS